MGHFIESREQHATRFVGQRVDGYDPRRQGTIETRIFKRYFDATRSEAK